MAHEPSDILAVPEAQQVTARPLTSLPVGAVEPASCSPGIASSAAAAASAAASASAHAETAAFLQTCSAATVALHADHELRLSADVAAPIHVSTTFWRSSDPEQLIPAADDEHAYPPETDAHVYSRWSSPNASRLEALTSAILTAPSLAYASGLAASHALYALLRPRRIYVTGGYHGVHGVWQVLRRITAGSHYVTVPLDDAAAQCAPGDVVHVETPLNPTGEVRDLEYYAAIAHERGAYLVVDATLGPPPLQNPFVHGADAVIHSGTKYLGGHSDLLLGIVATRHAPWFSDLVTDRALLGAMPGSMESWLAARSLRTLSARVLQQSATAATLVTWLYNALDPKIPIPQDPAPPTLPATALSALRSVLSRVQHSTVQAAHDPQAAAGWMRAQGGASPVFALVTTAEQFARRLPANLHLFAHATSLGGVESLIEWRALSDATVDRCVLRISVGLESPADLFRDLVGGCERLAREKRVE